MKDSSKTKQELIEELSVLKKKITKLEKSGSESRLAEDALRESEQKFSAAFDTNPIPTAISTIEDGRFLNVNDAFLEMFSFSSKTEIIGMTSVELRLFANPHDRQSTRKDLEETGRVYNKDLKMVAKDGRIFDMLFSAEPVLIGNKQCLLTTAVDITLRKQAENALNQSREQYRALVEDINDVIFTTDLQGKFTYVSPAVERISGFAASEVEGKFFSDFVHPDDLTGFASALSRRVRPNVSTEHEVRVLDKNGAARWVVTKSKVVLYNGKPHGISGIMTDITDRKRAEDTLRESESRYRLLVENASDVVFRTDNTGHFTFVNPTALRITGYKEDDLLGTHYPTLIRPDMRDEAIKFFGRQFVKGIQNTYSEYPILTKDGHEVWLGQNTQLIVEDGQVIGFQAVSRDITKRKQAEALLQQSEDRYRELSIIDDLTQLYNSRYFYHQLKIEIDRVDRYGQPLTLILFDLDDFKRFNDTYGHIEGDQVLMRFGRVVKRCLRQTDSAYRYGGEEFTVLMPMTTSKNGAVTAERIRAELKKEIFSPVSGKNVHITVSIGLSQYKPQEDMNAFVHRVDQLMYQVKKNGKDRVCSVS